MKSRFHGKLVDMADPISVLESELNWPAFYVALNHIAPWAMTGLPDGGREYIQTCGLASDAFWSDDLQDTAIELWAKSPVAAVNAVMEIFCENVRRAYCEMPLEMVDEWISVPSAEPNFTRECCINCIDFKITAPTLHYLLAAGRELSRPSNATLALGSLASRG